MTMVLRHILNFTSDINVQISAVNAGIWLSAFDWSIKIGFGLPTAIYICLKIYHEFIKKDKKSDTI